MRPRGHGRRECEEGVRKWGRGKEKRPAAAKASQLGTSTVLDLPLAVARSVAGGFARPTSPIRIGILAQANNSSPPTVRRRGPFPSGSFHSTPM